MKFRFKSFKVYQDSKKYCKFCRDIAEKHIKRKDAKLAFQIEGALNSIILNIAEGSADHLDIEFARFWESQSDQSMKPSQDLIWLYSADS